MTATSQTLDLAELLIWALEIIDQSGPRAASTVHHHEAADAYISEVRDLETRAYHTLKPLRRQLDARNN